MLREYAARQRPDEGRARWFSDDCFDLFIWYDLLGPDHITMFQLCYGKDTGEHALTYSMSNGFSHYSVDPGEDNPTKNRAPTFALDENFPCEKITRDFQERTKSIDSAVACFVGEKLAEFFNQMQEISAGVAKVFEPTNRQQEAPL